MTTNHTELIRRLRTRGGRRDGFGLGLLCDEAADALEAMQLELELRRKSGSAVDRLHNICEGIAADADGSEWSREEWERIDNENSALRSRVKELEAMISAPARRAGAAQAERPTACAALRKALKPFADADLTSPVVRDTFGFDVLRARAALQEQKS